MGVVKSEVVHSRLIAGGEGSTVGLTQSFENDFFNIETRYDVVKSSGYALTV